MALERKDRIKDQTTTTGTGTVNLDATAPAGGWRTFVSSVTSGATVRYLIQSADSSEWEVGQGVFTDGAPDTLTRVTVYSSTNSNNLVNFSAGTKTVSLIFAAQDMVDLGINGSTEKTTPVDADLFALADSAASYVIKKLSFLNIKVQIGSYLNPVGTIREFNVSTNPNTLLGFGTWSAHGAGRVSVAIDTGQTEFDVVDETGGAKTHTLTSGEMPSHTHGVTDPGHVHTIDVIPGDQDGSGSNGSILGSKNSGSATTGISINNTGGGGAHNNLQPYIVVYRWVRTA